MVKNAPVNAGYTRVLGLIPGSRRFLGGEHGNPLQYSCLENPMEKGTWWVTVHRVTKSRAVKSWTQCRDLAHTVTFLN